jgi:uncharacterized membrane protein YeaQ/YmgE (transglycosylase-associated protein family)
MEIHALIWLLVVGAVAGFLAGLIVKGYGFGLIGNIVVGIVGAAFGNWLLGHQFGINPGGDVVGPIITGVIGAVILLVLIGLIRRA